MPEDARTEDGVPTRVGAPESGTVTWPGGADLTPDTLYAWVTTGPWPNRNLAASAGVARRRGPLTAYA
jgi:hypothetical protein